MTKKNAREPVSKSLRLEVFKRDHFTCQYCGQKAPEVILHADHIRPVVEGGSSDILNLITACLACNLGKGAQLLDDRSAVTRQRAQIEELELRREQLEMMLAWRDAVQVQQIDVVEEISRRLAERGGGYAPSAAGKATLRRLLKTNSLEELLGALDESFDLYMRFGSDDITRAAWIVAFQKIPIFASMRRQAKDRPYLPKLLYIQGIMRNRAEEPHENYVDRLEGLLKRGFTLEDLEDGAKRTSGWDHLFVYMMNLARSQNGF
jgi:hypothetical protein